MNNHLTLAETLFITILATTFGIMWSLYSLVYAIFSPLLMSYGLSGLLEGFWHLVGIFFAYIIRKPGSAVLGETLAAIVESLISQWGISAIASGLCQGFAVELLLFLTGYSIWNKTICSLAGFLSALGGYIITYWWFGYSSFTWQFNLMNLTANLISGASLGGLSAYFLANKLAKAGVLNQFKISRRT